MQKRKLSVEDAIKAILQERPLRDITDEGFEETNARLLALWVSLNQEQRGAFAEIQDLLGAGNKREALRLFRATVWPSGVQPKPALNPAKSVLDK